MKSLVTKHKAFSFQNIYLIFVGIFAFLPFFAPLLYKFGFIFPAKLIYFAYSFFCHQFASRSLHLLDYQYAWCARDTGIWIGFFFGSLLIRFRKIGFVKWYWIILFIIPIALDGGMQTFFTYINIASGLLNEIPIYLSNNLVRFLTGSFFGFGISLWVTPNLFNNFVAQENKVTHIKFFENSKINFNFLKKISISVVFLFLIYFFSVQLWYITSNQNLPTNFLDSIPKHSTEFFLRRANGLCPTDGSTDIFNFECFFE